MSPQRGESKVLGILTLDSEAPTLPSSCGVPAFDLKRSFGILPCIAHGGVALGSSFESFF